MGKIQTTRVGKEILFRKKRLGTVSVIPRKKALIQYTKKLFEKKITSILLFEDTFYIIFQK
jgi:hypothetical protein